MVWAPPIKNPGYAYGADVEYLLLFDLTFFPLSVASLRGAAARPECHHFGVKPYDVKPQLHLICDEYLSFFTLFGSYPHLDRKPTDFAVKTFFFGLHILLENPLILQRKSYF